MSNPNLTLGKKGYTDYMKSLGFTQPDGKTPMDLFESLTSNEQEAWDKTIKNAMGGGVLIGAFVGVTVPTVAIVIFLAVKGLLTLL
jgi:hypothetical protein